LHRYIPETDTFRSFVTTGVQLDDDGHFIRALALDRSQNVWLGHARGISRFDRKREQFRDYTDLDGLDLVQYSSLVFHA